MVDVGQFYFASQCEGSALVSFPKPNLQMKIFLRYNGDPPYGLRGYLDDRVNRIIGFALVRQIREIPGNCQSPKLMRDYVESCTGDLLVNILMS